MKNKRKTRKLGLAMKQMMLICAIVCGAISLAVSISIFARSSDYKELARKETVAVSSLISLYIDHDQYMEAMKNGEGSVAFEKIRSNLSSAIEAGDMVYVYTLWTDGEQVYYGIDGDTKAPCSYGELFEETYEYLAPVFDGETIVDTSMQETEEGLFLITAYVPIYSDEGDVIGILACDYDSIEIKNMTAKAWSFLCLYAAIGTLVTGGGLFLVIRKTIQNINKLNDKIDELVYSDGDLTKEIELTSGDEIENLGNSVNALLKHIREIVVNISNGSSDVNVASQTIAFELNKAQEAITDTSATMEEMSAGMEETSASLIEITGSVGSVYNEITAISEKAGESAAYCNDVMNKANDISESSERAEQMAIEKTNEFASKIEEKIKNSQRVEEINEMVDTIMQISNQTNLLSLNASIEAARAGESGRGFAVVAGEIGKLATECKESASRISEVSEYVIAIVNDLAKEAGNMVEFTRQEISNNCGQLKETSENYKNDVREIGVLMQNFTASCDELQNVMDGIKDSIETTNVAVEETTRGIATTAEAMATLSISTDNIMTKANENVETSKRLDAEVNKFKF